MIGSIHILDLGLVIMIGFSIIFGLIKGLTRELFSLGFLVLGGALAYRFHPNLAFSLQRWIQNLMTRKLIAFLIVFLGILLVGAVVTWIIKRVFIRGPLKAIDRILGMALGLVRGLLIGAIISLLIYIYPFNIKWVDRSRLVPWFCSGMHTVARVLPNRFRKPLEGIYHDIQQKDQRNRRTI